MAHLHDESDDSCKDKRSANERDKHKASFQQSCHNPPPEVFFFISLPEIKLLLSVTTNQRWGPQAVKGCLSHLCICLNSFYLFRLNMALTVRRWWCELCRQIYLKGWGEKGRGESTTGVIGGVLTITEPTKVKCISQDNKHRLRVLGNLSAPNHISQLGI